MTKQIRSAQKHLMEVICVSKLVRCPFGKIVEKRLIDIDKSKSWLVQKVKEDTNKYFDAGYLQKILIGKRKPLSIIQSICKILNIESQNQ